MQWTQPLQVFRIRPVLIKRSLNDHVHFFPHTYIYIKLGDVYVGAWKQRDIFFPVFFLNLDKELRNYTRGIFCNHTANKALTILNDRLPHLKNLGYLYL